MGLEMTWRPGPAAVAVAIIGVIGAATAAFAEGAARDLTAFDGPGIVFTVPITIEVGAATTAGIEESPPSGWTVSNISDAGSWDLAEQEIKWGPFFDPSIPAQVTYDVTPPSEISGSLCFNGIIVFDTGSFPIAGDQCVASSVPAVSAWGLIVLTGSGLVAGALLFRRRPCLHPLFG